jgi:hypothetical protein
MRVQTGALDHPDGPSFSCLKSILEFFAWPSRRERFSRPDVVRSGASSDRPDGQLRAFFVSFPTTLISS